MTFACAAVFSLSLASCAPERNESKTFPTGLVNHEGPYSVGNTTVELEDNLRARLLTVEAWYPTTEPLEAPSSPIDFESSEEARSALSAAYETASACPTPHTLSRRDAALIPGATAFPLILFSHCLNCGRFSTFSLAERLASHGFIVLSVDHAGPLPFLLPESQEVLSPVQLRTRIDDLSILLETARNSSLFSQSLVLSELQIDPNKIGVYGHSFGAVTSGAFASSNRDIAALAGLAAPIENPLFPGVKMEDLAMPILLVLAEEDNSIREVGNRMLIDNYKSANGPIWRLDIADAGHWSISDVCGLTEAFEAGCGTGVRHSETDPGARFDYLPVSEGIQITQTYLTAFFLAQLMDRDDALDYLMASPEYAKARIHHRP